MRDEAGGIVQMEKVIVYKSDDTGMWWAEVKEANGKWRHVCELTHSDAIDAVAELLREAWRVTP